MLQYAHIFFLDHMLSTAWTLMFALWWYVYAAHDGRPASNSNHQATLMSLIESLEAQYRTPEQMKQLHHADYDVNSPEGMKQAQLRRESAERIWRSERGFAAGVLIAGWLVKVRGDCRTRLTPALLRACAVLIRAASSARHVLAPASVEIALRNCALRVPAACRR